MDIEVLKNVKLAIKKSNRLFYAIKEIEITEIPILENKLPSIHSKNEKYKVQLAIAKKEAESLNECQYRNAISLQEHFEEVQKYFFVTEYCNRRNLEVSFK